MLDEFLISNRTKLIARCRDKVAKRLSPSENLAALEHGVSHCSYSNLLRPFVSNNDLPVILSRQS
jgi:hypothetical protein